MLVVYPCYNDAFLALSQPQQLAFIALLPLIKATYKFLVARVTSEMDDLVPAIVASVDLFDALYTTKCMQAVGTIWVAVAIIVFDLVQNGVALYSLFKRFAVLRRVHARQNVSIGYNARSVVARVQNIFAKKGQIHSEPIPIESRSNLVLSNTARAELNRL
ncbi:hypothetical protein FI667_g15275, partial [Globisporangium splendens]